VVEVHTSPGGCNLGEAVEQGTDSSAGTWKMHFPSLFDLGKFGLLAGITVFAAWIASIGRVMYDLVMLVVAAALLYALVDLVDYEIVKRKRRG
jgi:hypothetical protein